MFSFPVLVPVDHHTISTVEIFYQDIKFLGNYHRFYSMITYVLISNGINLKMNVECLTLLQNRSTSCIHEDDLVVRH